MELILLIDFGSTYTKVTAVDLDAEKLIACVKAPTTVETNIMIGLNQAIEKLSGIIDRESLEKSKKIASSSAAGGLRMVAIGFVPQLTVTAAKMACLNAGAKLIGAHSYKLNSTEITDIIRKKPDIILLSGGTDGGNEEVIIHNAHILAESTIEVPILVAGNKTVQEKVNQILRSNNKDVRIVANVLPRVSSLNIEPARNIIREVFIEKIIQAKGVKQAEEFIERVLMPTPTAVLNAVKLLSEGLDDISGFGDLIVVDVGGATTDIYSVASGVPTRSNVILKGLPEPYAKRTVEANLGVRYNATLIMEQIGVNTLARMAEWDNPERVKQKILSLAKNASYIPQSREEKRLDIVLASSAVKSAINRHAGYIEEHFTPMGVVYTQHGKDLTQIKKIIGTGGPLVVDIKQSKTIFSGAFCDERLDLKLLKPVNPDFYIDKNYIIYAMGLLAEISPRKALKIMKKEMKLVKKRNNRDSNDIY